MAAVVQVKSGAQNTGLATVTVAWDTPATAGSLLVVIVGSDDYRTAGGIPTGFTESTGCKQETNLGHYLWWKVAAGGETSVSYTIGSASTSCWAAVEVSGLDAAPYDISAGQFTASGASSYTTPSITPTAGDRMVVASIGGSTSAANFTGVSTWLNSFVEQVETFTSRASGTRDIVGLATRSVTADGVTGYSSGATYSQNATGRTGITAAFKAAAGGATTHAGVASGSSTSSGSAAALLGLAAAATGASTSGGSAAAGRLMAAATTGASASSGSAAATIATGPVTHQATASGASTSAGSSAVTATLAASASGASAATGTAAATVVPPGPVTYQVSASGSATSAGSAAVTLRLAATAAGTAVSGGSAAGTVTGPTAAGAMRTAPRAIAAATTVRRATAGTTSAARTGAAMGTAARRSATINGG